MNQVDKTKLYRCTVDVGPSVSMKVGRFPVTGPSTHSTPEPISGGELQHLLAKQEQYEKQPPGKLKEARKVIVSDIQEAA